MPFVKTAYVSTQGTARQSDGGENIVHFGSVRMRLVGSGSLLMSLFSLDDVKSVTLIPFTMAATSNIEPTRICNFKEQRAAWKISTNNINEWFRVNRMVIFTKEVATNYPGTV